MATSVKICRCGTEAPPSVSLDAQDRFFWQACVECPVCGCRALAVGDEPVGSLMDAASRWNNLVSDPKIHVLPMPCRAR